MVSLSLCRSTLFPQSPAWQQWAARRWEQKKRTERMNRKKAPTKTWFDTWTHLHAQTAFTDKITLHILNSAATHNRGPLRVRFIDQCVVWVQRSKQQHWLSVDCLVVFNSKSISISLVSDTSRSSFVQHVVRSTARTYNFDMYSTHM